MLILGQGKFAMLFYPQGRLKKNPFRCIGLNMYSERSSSINSLKKSSRAIWHSTLSSGAKSLIVPDGSTDIIIKKKKAGLDIVFCGSMMNAVMLESKSETQYWGLRFKLGHGSQFFNFSMAESLNQIIDISKNFEINKLDDFMEFPEKNTFLIEQEISKYLINKINETSYQTNLQKINQLGHTSFGDISTQAKSENISRRQQSRIFKAYFGYSARDLSQIKKFNKLIETSSNNQNISLTELANISGYYDQADMNRAVKSLCQLTPKELMSQMYNTY